jgi:ABC-type phosphate transport system substrate-binding protein
MRGRTIDDDRGQTPQDFAIGMSIFLLAVLTVLTFVPSIFTPFTAPETAIEGQADRASTAAMGNLTVDGSSTRLNASATESWFADYQSRPTEDLATALGLEPYRSVNVSVVPLDATGNTSAVTITANSNTTTLTAGERYTGQSSSTMVRIVTIPGLSGDTCEPGCRLVVRVW